ncbi:MAG TPA: benzoate-CoA ligase family protein [Acidimicrobiales bacterium]|nr:benzoate-CoA ligase family protein [Acidimicrobiales bacterium]
MLRYRDIPQRFNVASWFVDRNLEVGRGDRTALLVGDRTTTYAELATLTNKVGNVLHELGVRRQHRVLLALSDGVDFVATWYGAQKLGAVTAEVYTYLQPKDYAYYLNYTEAEVVVVDGVTLEAMREAAAGSLYPRHLLVVGVAEDDLRSGEHSFETLVAQAPATLEPAPTTRDDVAIWKFTTGSTGEPKACVHPTHSPLLSFDWYARGVLDIGEDDQVLPVPKLFFGYARDLAALYPFGVGAAGIVFPERTTPERIFGLIARHRPTILVNVPTMMSAMVAHPDAAEQDLGCLRLCTSAGEALPAELHRRWDETFGVEVVDGIGSSEAYHIYISNRPGRGRAGTVGQVVPGYQARVIDETGATVPDGEVGVLEVTGETVAREYWRAPERSALTFKGDTLVTGDLFVRDADGFFSYRGRADDLLKVGGIWVAPSEVEACLIGHPDVVECAVAGHEHQGLVRPRAYVVPRAGADVSAESLIEFARHALSPHKRPRDVRFVDELPRTTNGKLDRRALREIDKANP